MGILSSTLNSVLWRLFTGDPYMDAWKDMEPEILVCEEEEGHGFGRAHLPY